MSEFAGLSAVSFEFPLPSCLVSVLSTCSTISMRIGRYSETVVWPILGEVPWMDVEAWIVHVV